MSRQRMVKPEFFESESLGACSIRARLAFIGLWVTGDDYGNQKAQASRLKLKIFPYDSMTDDEFIGLLVELEEVGCIKGYIVDGERYITVPNFDTYQTVRKPTKSNIPEPPKSVLKQRRTTVIRDWKNGVPIDEYDTSTSLVTHQYDTSNAKERKNEGRKRTLKSSLSNEYAPTDADAVRTASLVAIRCPQCGSQMERTGLRRSGTDRHIWRCTQCHEEVAE